MQNINLYLFTDSDTWWGYIAETTHNFVNSATTSKVNSVNILSALCIVLITNIFI